MKVQKEIYQAWKNVKPHLDIDRCLNDSKNAKKKLRRFLKRWWNGEYNSDSYIFIKQHFRSTVPNLISKNEFDSIADSITPSNYNNDYIEECDWDEWAREIGIPVDSDGTWLGCGDD